MRYNLMRFAGERSVCLASADDVRQLLIILASHLADIVLSAAFAEYVIRDTENVEVYYRVKMSN